MKPNNCIEVLAEKGIHVKDNQAIRCPLHDHNDTVASFSVCGEVYNCFSHPNNNGTGDYIKLYALLNNMTNGEAFKALEAKPFNANSDLKEQLKSPNSNEEMMKLFAGYNSNEVSGEVKRYLTLRGISYDRVGSFISSRGDDVILPMKNQHGYITGLQSRSIYNKAFKIEHGSQAGVFWKNNEEGEDLFIVEGMFDWLSLRQWTPHVLGFLSATALIDVSEIVNKYKTIYWLGDMDEAGKSSLERFKKHYHDKKILTTGDRNEDVNDLIVALRGEDPVETLKGLCTESVGYKELPVSTTVNSYTWGGDFIDEHIVTMKKGEIIILAAVENAGKSSFANFVARKNHERYGHRTVYFSLESTKEQVHNNIALSYAGVNNLEYRDNKHLNNERYLKRLKTLTEDNGVDIIGMNADQSVTMESIEAELRELKQVDLLIVDNLTCIKKEGINDEQQMAPIMLKFMWLAREMNIPIVIVHHMRKKQGDGESKGKFTSNDSIVGSGLIKNFAYTILQVARNRKPMTEVEKSEFYIRETKARTDLGIQKEVECYYYAGDFHEEPKGTQTTTRKKDTLF